MSHVCSCARHVAAYHPNTHFSTHSPRPPRSSHSIGTMPAPHAVLPQGAVLGHAPQVNFTSVVSWHPTYMFTHGCRLPATPRPSSLPRTQCLLRHTALQCACTPVGAHVFLLWRDRVCSHPKLHLLRLAEVEHDACGQTRAPGWQHRTQPWRRS